MTLISSYVNLQWKYYDKNLLEFEKIKLQSLISESQEREKDRLEKKNDRQEREKDGQCDLQTMHLKQIMSYERSSNVDITKFIKLTLSFSESNPDFFFQEI